LRILFAAHQFFPEHYAGVEIVTLGLARELRARGHESFVLAPKRSIPGNDIEPGEVEDYEYEGVPVRRVGRPKEGFSRPYRLDYENETMAERAREYVQEIEPDIVHAEHFQGLSASVIPVFKESGAPLVYKATDFWTICPVVDLRRHDGKMCTGPEVTHCTRCVASRHQGSRMQQVVDRTPDAGIQAAAALAGTRLGRRSHALSQVGALAERPEFIRERMGQVDRIIVYTELMRELLLANDIGEERIQVSPYGIDTSRIPAPQNDNVPPPLRIGYIGTMAPHKGCDILIEAVKSLPRELDASLTIYGNLERFKPFVKQLRRLAGDDERIEFAGPFQREEVGEILAELDTLVVPSRWYENQPGVILEAFAAGMPVVATNLGGMSEFVHHEKNGLLFELEDHEDLARQLCRLGEESGLIQRLRARIGSVKTVRQDVDELEELYGDLIKEKAREGSAT
jgi:glycosyltransferase involved in cell wall biosynthesis